MRYSGEIGYYETEEVKPGFFKEKVIFRKAYGDVLRNIKRDSTSSTINEKLTISNSISIVADPYARDHFFNIRCAKWQNALWEVKSVDVQWPRLNLELGGIYNEDLE